MRIDFYISNAEAEKFVASCEAAIRNVDRATKSGTELACREILEESLKQVPRDTGTLASTAFYDVQRRTTTKRYTYEGIIGYAGMAGHGFSRDKLNLKSRAMASEYAVRVHEDLHAVHANGGKAKFLEDPVRAYGASRFKRVAEDGWRWAIQTSNAGGTSIIPVPK